MTKATKTKTKGCEPLNRPEKDRPSPLHASDSAASIVCISRAGPIPSTARPSSQCCGVPTGANDRQAIIDCHDWRSIRVSGSLAGVGPQEARSNLVSSEPLKKGRVYRIKDVKASGLPLRTGPKQAGWACADAEETSQEVATSTKTLSRRDFGHLRADVSRTLGEYVHGGRV